MVRKILSLGVAALSLYIGTGVMMERVEPSVSSSIQHTQVDTPTAGVDHKKTIVNELQTTASKSHGKSDVIVTASSPELPAVTASKAEVVPVVVEDEPVVAQTVDVQSPERQVATLDDTESILAEIGQYTN